MSKKIEEMKEIEIEVRGRREKIERIKKVIVNRKENGEERIEKVEKGLNENIVKELGLRMLI